MKRLRGICVIGVGMLLPALSAEGPTLAGVRFEGPPPPGLERIQREYALETGAPFDPEEAAALSDALLEAWHMAGYPLARIRWRAVAGESGLELVMLSEPGERGPLRRLVFEGNRALSEEDLRAGLELVPRPGMWNRITGRSLLFLEHLGKDAATLLEHYHRRGHMGAEIGQPVVRFVPELEGYEIRWPVSEGGLYRFGRVDLAAGTPPEIRTLASAAGVSPGAPFSPMAMAALRDRVLDRLQQRGFGFAEFQADPVWRDSAEEVDITLSVQNGPRVGLGDLVVSGNHVTDQTVIRRELDLKSGEGFHASTLRDFEQRLRQSGWFETVDVRYRQRGADRFDIEVSVEEARTGRVETGLAYGSEEGPSVLLRAEEINFSLRPPFRGGGKILEAEARAGPEIRKVDGGLTLPRVRGSLWRMEGSVFYEDNRYLSDVYDQRGYGASLVAAYPLSSRLSLFTGPQWSAYRLEDIEEGFSQVPGVEPNVNLTGWLAGWILDHTDRPFRPRRGPRLEQTLLYGTEAMGGDTDILDLRLRGALYLNPFRDHVLLFRGGIHTVDPRENTDTVPVALRTYLGGTATLRGFEYRSVSPLNEEGTPVGGESAWWVSAEYLLPVLSRLDLSAYIQAGDVGKDAFRLQGGGPVSNWGVGLVIRAENFPVRIDVASPLQTLEGDRINKRGEPHIGFSAGYRF